MSPTPTTDRPTTGASQAATDRATERAWRASFVATDPGPGALPELDAAVARAERGTVLARPATRTRTDADRARSVLAAARLARSRSDAVAEPDAVAVLWSLAVLATSEPDA